MEKHIPYNCELCSGATRRCGRTCCKANCSGTVDCWEPLVVIERVTSTDSGDSGGTVSDILNGEYTGFCEVKVRDLDDEYIPDQLMGKTWNVPTYDVNTIKIPRIWCRSCYDLRYRSACKKRMQVYASNYKFHVYRDRPIVIKLAGQNLSTGITPLDEDVYRSCSLMSNIDLVKVNECSNKVLVNTACDLATKFTATTVYVRGIDIILIFYPKRSRHVRKRSSTSELAPPRRSTSWVHSNPDNYKYSKLQRSNTQVSIGIKRGGGVSLGSSFPGSSNLLSRAAAVGVSAVDEPLCKYAGVKPDSLLISKLCSAVAAYATVRLNTHVQKLIQDMHKYEYKYIEKETLNAAQIIIHAPDNMYFEAHAFNLPDAEELYSYIFYASHPSVISDYVSTYKAQSPMISTDVYKRRLEKLQWFLKSQAKLDWNRLTPHFKYGTFIKRTGSKACLTDSFPISNVDPKILEYLKQQVVINNLCDTYDFTES